MIVIADTANAVVVMGFIVIVVVISLLSLPLSTDCEIRLSLSL